MRSRLVMQGLLALATLPALGRAQADTSLVAPGAKLERVFCCGVFLEGPAAAPDGTIYFSDITGTHHYRKDPRLTLDGVIRRYDPKTGKTTVYQSPSAMANGIKFAANGDMYVAHGADLGTRIVTRTDMATGLGYVAAARYQGRPFNAPNDIAIDRQGRVYFSDPRYLGDESIDQPVLGVYRIDLDGTVTLVASDIGKPNGLAFSPDEKTLYVASVGTSEAAVVKLPAPPRSTLEALVAYDVRPDGSLGPARVLVDFHPDRGPTKTFAPDGIDTDVHGNIWATHAGWKAVRVFSPSGREIGRIELAEGAANLEFGRGAEADVLYLAAWTSLYRVKVKTRGWHPGEK